MRPSLLGERIQATGAKAAPRRNRFFPRSKRCAGVQVCALERALPYVGGSEEKGQAKFTTEEARSQMLTP